MTSIILPGSTVLAGLDSQYQSPFGQHIAFEAARGGATVIFLTDTRGEGNAAVAAFKTYMRGETRSATGVVNFIPSIRQYQNAGSLFKSILALWHADTPLVLVRDLGRDKTLSPDDPWFALVAEIAKRADSISILTILALGPHSAMARKPAEYAAVADAFWRIEAGTWPKFSVTRIRPSPEVRLEYEGTVANGLVAFAEKEPANVE